MLIPRPLQNICRARATVRRCKDCFERDIWPLLFSGSAVRFLPHFHCNLIPCSADIILLNDECCCVARRSRIVARPSLRVDKSSRGHDALAVGCRICAHHAATWDLRAAEVQARGSPENTFSVRVVRMCLGCVGTPGTRGWAA